MFSNIYSEGDGLFELIEVQLQRHLKIKVEESVHRIFE